MSSISPAQSALPHSSTVTIASIFKNARTSSRDVRFPFVAQLAISRLYWLTGTRDVSRSNWTAHLANWKQPGPMREAMIVLRVFSSSGLKIKPKFWSNRKFWTDLPTSFYQSCNKISRNYEKKTSNWRNNSETNHNSPKSPTDLIFLSK